MAVSYFNLVGSYENPDKTIAFHLSADWTETIVPVFENGTDEPDYEAQYHRAGPNTILVNFIKSERISTHESNSDTIHAYKDSVVITIIAESRVARILFENEVNRILWEMNVNSSNRLLKSDASNSHIAYFEKSELDFAQIDISDNDTAYLQGSEAILFPIYYKQRS